MLVEDLQATGVFEHRVRMIYSGVCESGVSERRKNHERVQLYGEAYPESRQCCMGKNEKKRSEVKYKAT